MDHDRGDGNNRIKLNSSEDEEGYSSSSFFGSQMELCKKNYRRRFIGEYSSNIKMTSDDADQEFWAEDELSSSESRLSVATAKCKRRHSVAHRNRTYRSRSRNENRSSSSSLSNSRLSPAKRRRKKQKPATSSDSRSSTIKKSRSSKNRLLKIRKK